MLMAQTVKFLRLPRPGTRCPVTGLSRSTLYQLITPSLENRFNPPVKSYTISRKKGLIRGTRLISYDSLVQYIESFPAAHLVESEAGAMSRKEYKNNERHN
jgi:hypothetical protein